MTHQGIVTCLLSIAIAISCKAQNQLLETNLFTRKPIIYSAFKEPSYYDRNNLLLKKKYNIRIDSDDESIEKGKDLFVLPEMEVWRVSWNSYNYLSDNKIEPGFFYSPSVSFKYKKFEFKFSFVSDFGSTAFLSASATSTGVTSIKPSADLFAGEIFSKTKMFDFESKVNFGRLRGVGTWSAIADTINFNVENYSIDINSNTLSAIFLIGFNGIKPFIGVKYVKYNSPAYMVGQEIIDPRDSTERLIWATVKDTRFTHFFLVLDPVRYCFRNVYAKDESDKKTLFKIQGHLYTMFGFGYASNDTLGKVVTMSFPFYATGNNTLGFPFGVELDLALKLMSRIGKKNTGKMVNMEKVPHFTTAIGFRYTNWSIISFPKNDLQLRSNEFYWGPYMMATIQF